MSALATPPAKKHKDPAERAAELISKLGQAHGKKALEIAEDLFRIAEKLPTNSQERWKIAVAIFTAAITEPSVGFSSQIGAYVDRLGYESERIVERDPETGAYRTTYNMRTREEPRTKIAKAKPIRKPQRPEEPRQEEKPKVAELEGPPKPPPPVSEPKPTAEQKAELLAQAQQKYGEPKIFSILAEKRLEKYLSKLPQATTEAGRESQRRVGRDALVSAARVRMDMYDLNHPNPKPAARLEDLAPQNQVVIKTPFFNIPLPIYSPKMYFDYAESKKWATHPLRNDSLADVPLPEVVRMSGRNNADAVERYMLIVLLDNPFASMLDRIAAAENIGRFRVSEALPLLASIVENPAEHNAQPQLVSAAKDALSRIKSS